MKIGDFLKTTKGKVVTLASGAGVIAVGIAVAVLMQGSGYRSIAVDGLEGTVNVVGEKNNGNAYVGQNLYSGDDVTVASASSLTMCMDGDKYVYADADTHFSLEASKPKDDSRIKLNLDAGSELNELKNKLADGESYVVDTPNSTMSVRGTTFRVSVYKGEDGLWYTLLEVISGTVEVALKTEDGTYNGIVAQFGEGQAAMVRGNSEFSEFIVGEENEEILIFDYKQLPENAVPRVEMIISFLKDNMIVGDIEEQHLEDEEEASDGNVTTEASGDVEEDDKAEEEAEVEEAEADANEASENASTAAADTEAHVHTPGEWMIVISPSCGAQGARQQFCTECNALLASELLPASGNHIRGHWVTTLYGACNYEGTEQEECPNCGAVFGTRSTGYGEHTYSGGKCVVCGQSDPSYSQTVSGSSTCSHVWNYTPLNQQPFTHQKKCGICGETKIEGCTPGLIDNKTVCIHCKQGIAEW